jgi:hypothetical protein
MSSKYFYKNGTFSHVAAKLCLFCKKPKEKNLIIFAKIFVILVYFCMQFFKQSFAELKT